MNTIHLAAAIVTDPDLGAFRFYIAAGRVFDARDYAEAFGLNRADLDAADVQAAQDMAAQLKEGEWLEVSHDAPL